ncbi:MAG TPA: hypothetical protein VFG37_03125 [Planctomycetota bacterium]|nr:hypothetical protein [Planctomycetota bacterium]
MTISVLLHALVLTLLTVVVLHEKPAEGANGPPQTIALAPPRLERIDPAPEPPPLVERTNVDLATMPPPDPDSDFIPEANPTRRGDFSPDSQDDTAPPGPINWDPDALDSMPNSKKGGTSIGVNGPGHYGNTDAYEGRGKDRGKGGGRADPNGGGRPKKEDKVTASTTAALQWLANHQSPDGRWDCDGFDANCKKSKCDGRGEATYDVGVTGLALLCFLGAGFTHQEGPFKKTVKDGLLYLKSVQDEDGIFGGKSCPHYQYNHACAALAMAEAFGMTGANAFREPARKGVAWVGRSQNPYRAWRYGCADGDNDTSVTGWMTMVLKSAAMSGIDVEHQSLDHAAAFIDEMTEENGRTGYQQKGGWPARVTGPTLEKFPAQNSESLTAVGMLVRIFDGHAAGADPSIGKGADLLVAQLPKWDPPSIDFYYWYYGTLAMFQVGGPRWEKWNAAMKTAIVDHQRLDRAQDEFGSWDPVDPWSQEGGRVYATALNCLCTEVYYRYPRVFGGSTGAAKPK